MKSQLWLLVLVSSCVVAGCGQPQRPVPVRTGETDLPAEPTIEVPAEPTTPVEKTTPAEPTAPVEKAAPADPATSPEPKTPADPTPPSGPKTSAEPESTPPAADKPAAKDPDDVTR